MIHVTNLTKKFGENMAVNDVSFHVQKGEIFAFLGPNGAGKTTTIKMLTTLLTPTSGQIQVNGFDPLREQMQVRRQIGIVFQDPSLDGELTAFFDLWERRGELVKKFSGGMKRRLEIARGLLHAPLILFLDEPTLGLDPQSRNQLWKQVKLLNESEGVTVFLTTHYMDEAERVAQRIAVIDHGKIIALGSPTELKEQTNTTSLEEAFLALTGATIRDESATSVDQMRQFGKMWKR
jgi:ABC-2 type transport system ATP-binding protein